MCTHADTYSHIIIHILLFLVATEHSSSFSYFLYYYNFFLSFSPSFSFWVIFLSAMMSAGLVRQCKAVNGEPEGAVYIAFTGSVQHFLHP